MMSAVLGAALVAGPCARAFSAPMSVRAHARIERPLLRLGDIADVSTLPAALQARAASLALVRIEARRVRLSRAYLAARARAVMPLLRCALSDERGDVVIDLHESPRASGFAGLPARNYVVAKGDRLAMVTSAGAVRVTRDVEALQAARPGERLFVRDAGGQVIAARYAERVR